VSAVKRSTSMCSIHFLITSNDLQKYSLILKSARYEAILL